MKMWYAGLQISKYFYKTFVLEKKLENVRLMKFDTKY